MDLGIVIFLPDPLRSDILERQMGFDPGLRPNLPPHITVKRPFRPQGNQAAVEQAIAAVAARWQPFPISLDGVGVWTMPGNHTIYVKVAESQALRALHNDILGALASLAAPAAPQDALFEGPNFVPHATILYQLDDLALGLAQSDMEDFHPRLDFVATEISLVGTIGRNVWTTVRAFPLGGTIGSSDGGLPSEAV